MQQVKGKNIIARNSILKMDAKGWGTWNLFMGVGVVWFKMGTDIIVLLLRDPPYLSFCYMRRWWEWREVVVTMELSVVCLIWRNEKQRTKSANLPKYNSVGPNVALIGVPVVKNSFQGHPAQGNLLLLPLGDVDSRPRKSEIWHLQATVRIDQHVAGCQVPARKMKSLVYKLTK